MQVEIWSKDNCKFCTKVKEILEARNIPFTEIDVGILANKELLLEKVPNARTVPQIFIEGIHIGGYTDLVGYLSKL